MPNIAYRPCASILVLRKTDTKIGFELLLVHKPRKNDAWQLPQGGVEEGESLEDAAKRELLEETGIDIAGNDSLRMLDQTYRYDYPEEFIRDQRPAYSGQKLVFLTVTVSSETEVAVDRDEIDEYQWVHPNELPRFLKREEYLAAVQSLIATVARDYSDQ